MWSSSYSNLLTSQLDRKLVFHNVTMADLQMRVDKVLQKGRELLETSAKLREENLDFEVRLLSRLEELQKVREEVSDLQGKFVSA